MLTRRRFLVGATGVAVGATTGLDRAPASAGQSVPPVGVGTQPPGLPARQHAWAEHEARDAGGNRILPRFNRLLLFDVAGKPTPAHARVLEAALRTLERTYPWGHGGLLFAAGWSPGYFERALGVRTPIPYAQALSDFEQPAIDGYDMCLHLASDHEDRLAAVEAALIHGAVLTGADGPLDVSAVLRWRETRTGFTGSGLPARHQEVAGIPPGKPVPRGAPLFMGFRSSLRRNQAGEDDVTIRHGPFAGGTTMQVSYMRLRLDGWYRDLDERQRVARMYAPQVTPDQVAQFTRSGDAASNPTLLEEAITSYGVVGHAQASAQARRQGRPLLLRRDFNTVDGGHAGLHFVSVQRTIEDFVTTRSAMNATAAQLQNPAITDTVNNGINAFMFVLKRANYVLPVRGQRSFPLLPGRELALD